MSVIFTDEQRTAIEDDLVSQAVVACAGSGKTLSAVHRVATIRKRMKQTKGYVALLSYSNVAVDTFRAEYSKIVRSRQGLSDRVVIATVDSFITTNVLLPHGARSMGCNCRPFLVQGDEAWLKGYTFSNGTYPVPIKNLVVSLEGSDFRYLDNSAYGNPKAVAEHAVKSTIARLGKVGAYTHSLGRYWALKTLVEQQRLIAILARRYPFILIDEAQDIGTMHGAFVSLLLEAGVVVSLIGDPNQAIYEFADADGSFLRSFAAANGVLQRPLTENRRSVPQIVAVASALAMTDGKAIRHPPVRKHGAYFLFYEQNKLEELVDTFKAILSGHAYAGADAAILCRGIALTEAILGGGTQMGIGATERLAQAAVHRDLRGDMSSAFQCALDGVLRLLESPPATLRAEILGGAPSGDARTLRRLLWQFIRHSSDCGVPEGFIRAKDEWHPRLKQRLPSLFEKIEDSCPLRRSSTWGNNLTTKGLSERPFLRQDLISVRGTATRTQTVHKVKGEGIDAVMYVARKADIESMLAGTSTEDGRIGYVAVTRARDLLIVAIPANTTGDVIKGLQAKGFLAWS